nr:hypothetical protein [Patescibacteria group bacterium]MBP9710216.1 hypothetical protein [Patescibacteria group bacterium]
MVGGVKKLLADRHKKAGLQEERKVPDLDQVSYDPNLAAWSNYLNLAAREHREPSRDYFPVVSRVAIEKIGRENDLSNAVVELVIKRFDVYAILSRDRRDGWRRTMRARQEQRYLAAAEPELWEASGLFTRTLISRYHEQHPEVVSFGATTIDPADALH